MSVAYLKTLHGLLNLLQTGLGVFALLAGYFIWNDDSIYFLVYLSKLPLITLNLLFLSIALIASFAILIGQLFGDDLLEGLGKFKILLIHGTCGALLLACAVISTIYFFSNDDTYTRRLCYVMISCWIWLIGYIIQFGVIVLQ